MRTVWGVFLVSHDGEELQALFEVEEDARCYAEAIGAEIQPWVVAASLDEQNEEDDRRRLADVGAMGGNSTTQRCEPSFPSREQYYSQYDARSRGPIMRPRVGG